MFDGRSNSFSVKSITYEVAIHPSSEQEYLHACRGTYKVGDTGSPRLISFLTIYEYLCTEVLTGCTRGAKVWHQARDGPTLGLVKLAVGKEFAHAPSNRPSG
jgi:hypothetical protein